MGWLEVIKSGRPCQWKTFHLDWRLTLQQRRRRRKGGPTIERVGTFELDFFKNILKIDAPHRVPPPPITKPILVETTTCWRFRLFGQLKWIFSNMIFVKIHLEGPTLTLDSTLENATLVNERIGWVNNMLHDDKIENAALEIVDENGLA
jgi:hypothetical protein